MQAAKVISKYVSRKKKLEKLGQVSDGLGTILELVGNATGIDPIQPFSLAFKKVPAMISKFQTKVMNRATLHYSIYIQSCCINLAQVKSLEYEEKGVS